jgi:hypothetical protein
MKRSGFKRKEPAPGEPRQYSSFKRKEPKEAKPRKRMAPMSKKRAALLYGDGDAAAIRRGILERRPVCETCPRIAGLVDVRCSYDAVDVHEVLARSAGGSITDESNVLTTCRWAHDWIGDHPNEATKLGLRRSRYNRPEGKTS